MKSRAAPRAAPRAALGAIAIFTTSTGARATYSVLLTDTATGEIGGAVTSCVGDFDLEHVFGTQVNTSVPAPEESPAERIAFFTQGLYSEENHDQVSGWIASGFTPSAVVDAITAQTFDPRASERQYHLLSTSGYGLTWTGDETLPYSGGLTHSEGTWTYTLAGNILTSERVLSNMDAALRAGSGSIEERLLVALEAGGAQAEGDARCRPNPGDSAFITVIDASGSTRIRHSVIDTGPRDPLELLRLALFPSPADTSVSASTSAPIVNPSTPPSGPSAPAQRGTRGGSCAVTHRSLPYPPIWWVVLLGLGKRRFGKRRSLA